MKIPKALKTPQIVLSIVACLAMSCTVYKDIPTASLAENLAKVPNSIRAGDVISITLKNEIIQNLKVTAADSEKIAGAQSVITNGKWTIQKRIVSRSEIVRIQKPRHRYEVIMPEDMLRMTLKNGEQIKDFRVKGIDLDAIRGVVKEIDSLTIVGIETYDYQEDGPRTKSRQTDVLIQIKISDILEIRKKGYSEGNTAVLVLVAGIVTTFIITMAIVFRLSGG